MSGLTILIDSLRSLLKFTCDERMLASSSISFDISIVELLVPLTSGAATVLVEKSLLLHPKRISLLCRKAGVTAIQAGPSLWRGLLDASVRLPQLNIAISGGEAFPPDLVAPLVARAGAAWNGYGPTEATIYATYERLHSGSIQGFDAAQRVSIGRPVGPVDIRPWDKNGAEVQADTAGEICVAGPTLARGYLDQPTTTADRFRTDVDGARYYRTGDIGIKGLDGRISFVGRMDGQLNINGIRFEPEELEAAVRVCRAVEDAAVATIDGKSGVSVVAAVRLRDRESTDAAALRRELESLLPASECPSRFQFVDMLPRTPSGKVDRKAVAEIFAIAANSETEINMETATATLDRVVEITADILDAPGLDADTDIFTVGADSLAALNLVLDLEGEFGCEIEVEQIIDARTPRYIAALIAGGANVSGGMSIPRAPVLTPDRSIGRPLAADPFVEANSIPDGLLPREPRPFMVPALLNTPEFPSDVMQRLRTLASNWPGEASSDVVPLGLFNPSGTRTPVFWCFNAAQEPVELARCLGQDQPLFALRSLNKVLPPGEERHAYAEDLGTIYATEIMRVYPHGPFVIGGNCMAADVAIAAARRLLLCRRQIALLALLEAPIDSPYPGRVALFFGRESPVNNQLLGFNQPELGWRRLVRDVTVDEIPGRQGTFFRQPNSISFAERLSARIAEVWSHALPILPPTACHAKLRLLSDLAGVHLGGHSIALRVRIWNESDHIWQSTEHSGITLASRWRDAEGAVIELGGAVALASDVPPSGLVEVVINVRVPRLCGPFELEIDLCEEGIAWFSARGSVPFKRVLHIEAAQEGQRPAQVKPAQH